MENSLVIVTIILLTTFFLGFRFKQLDDGRKKNEENINLQNDDDVDPFPSYSSYDKAYNDRPYEMHPKDRYYINRYRVNKFLDMVFGLYASNDWIKINYENYQKFENKYLIKEEWYLKYFRDELEKIAILYHEKKYGVHYDHFDIDEMKYKEWEEITRWHTLYVRNTLNQPHLPKFPKDSGEISDDEALYYRAISRFNLIK